MGKKNIIASIVIMLAFVGGAILLRASRSSSSLQEISQSKLSEADGKEGRACWLAVDGVVYEIEQGYKWIDGAHTESQLAYCGADMSSAIDQAPHGRTKLSQLRKVGVTK